ncbi:hypothetical protein HCN44_002807 [Aphidius gifuensis]|uniref:Uncharacterized protein n=1 Tax=Aphidius gifuensis TaxID=684658 RepID=A0A834XPX6_APHGI|nr:hypothetical protein HCN44_002807 [Aphidius gifuensis]
MDKIPNKPQIKITTSHDSACSKDDEVIIVYDKKSPINSPVSNPPGEHLKNCCFNYLHECTCKDIIKYKINKSILITGSNKKHHDDSSGINSSLSSCSSDCDSYWLKTKSFSYSDTSLKQPVKKRIDISEILKRVVDDSIDGFDANFSSFDSTQFQTLALDSDLNICSLLNKSIFEMSDDSSLNETITLISQLAYQYDKNPDMIREKLVTIIEESIIHYGSPSIGEKNFYLFKNIIKLIENESEPSGLEINDSCQYESTQSTESINKKINKLNENKLMNLTNSATFEKDEFAYLEILCNSLTSPRKEKSSSLRRSISTPNLKVINAKETILKKCQAQQQSLDDCLCVNKTRIDTDSTQERWDTYYGDQVFSPKNYTSDLSNLTRTIIKSAKKADSANDVSITNSESPKTPEKDELLHSKMLCEKSAAPKRSKSPFYLEKRISVTDLKESEKEKIIKESQKQQLDNFVDNINKKNDENDDLNKSTWDTFDSHKNNKSFSKSWSIDSLLHDDENKELKSIIVEAIKKRSNCLQSNVKKTNKSSVNTSVFNYNKLKEVFEFIKEAEKYLNYLMKHDKTIQSVVELINKNQSSDSGVGSSGGYDLLASNCSSNNKLSDDESSKVTKSNRKNVTKFRKSPNCLTTKIASRKSLVFSPSLSSSKRKSHGLKYPSVGASRKIDCPGIIVTPNTPIENRHSIISASPKFFKFNNLTKSVKKIKKTHRAGRFFVTPKKTPKMAITSYDSAESTTVSKNKTPITSPSYESFLKKKTIKSPVGEYIRGKSPIVSFKITHQLSDKQ